MLTYDVEVVELEEQAVAVVRGDVTVGDIPAFLGRAFGDVLTALSAQGLTPAGPPFGRYVPSGSTFAVEAGFPTTGVVAATSTVVPSTLPGGTAARVMHLGDYAGVAGAYEAATAWLAQQGYVVAAAPWECYLDGPEVARPRTLVLVPCRHTD
jgi:effector-binding domain-containing protein